MSSIGGKYHHSQAERTSYFSFEGLLNVLSLFQKLRQHFPNIPPNAQGTGLDRLRAEGLVLIDADVQRSRILNGELPERHFDDAGGVVAGAKFQKKDFGGLVAAERNSKACQNLLKPFVKIHCLSAASYGF